MVGETAVAATEVEEEEETAVEEEEETAGAKEAVVAVVAVQFGRRRHIPQSLNMRQWRRARYCTQVCWMIAKCILALPRLH